jgi:hypothetical protein
VQPHAGEVVGAGFLQPTLREPQPAAAGQQPAERRSGPDDAGETRALEPGIGLVELAALCRASIRTACSSGSAE